MALSDILATIEQETKDKVEAIYKQNESDKKDLQAKLDKELAEKKEKVLKQIKYQANKKVSQASWEQSAELQTALLTKKQALLDDVFKAALAALGDLADADYKKLIVSLLNSLPTLDSEAKIVATKGKERITSEALSESKCELQASDKSIESTGGFLVETAEMTIDMTFESLIQSYRADNESEVAQELFK